MQAVTISNDPCLCCGDVERVMKRVEPYTFCLWCFEKRFGDSAEVPKPLHQSWRLAWIALQQRMVQRPERARAWRHQTEDRSEKPGTAVDEARNC